MSLCIFLICICNIAVSIRSVFLIGLSNPDNEIRLSFITLNQHKIALYQHFYHYVPSLLINTVVNILLNGIVFLLSVFYDRIPIMFLSKATTLCIFCYAYMAKMCKSISNEEYSLLSHFLRHSMTMQTFLFVCVFLITILSTKVK